jgi:succinyl-CoA synthetase beta subunit
VKAYREQFKLKDGGEIGFGDVIAEGVVAAVKEVGLQVPLVVRLEGTNVDLGKKIIAESKLNVTSADDLDDAAQKIVAAVKKAA